MPPRQLARHVQRRDTPSCGALAASVCSKLWPLLRAVSEWVKANVSCPFLIIRRSAVAKRGMKISSQSGGATSPTAGSTPPPDLQLGCALRPTTPAALCAPPRLLRVACRSEGR